MSYPDIKHMEQELRAALQETAAGSTRAMSASLAILSEYQHAEQADTLVDTLMGRRPVRVLHLRGNAPSFSSRAAARCAMDRQSRGVCFEDIYIESTGTEAYEGRVWGSLLVRELPVLLLWKLGIEQLASCTYDCTERVDLILIDPSSEGSHDTDSVERFRDILLEVSEETGPFCDLAWEKSLSFRYALSRLFEGDQAQNLKELQKVVLTGIDLWTLHLLAGWLRSRLNTQELSLDIQVQTTDPSLMEQAFLYFNSDSDKASVCMNKDGRGHLVFRDASTRDISLPEQSPALILERLIDAPLADPLYREALKMI